MGTRNYESRSAITAIALLVAIMAVFGATAPAANARSTHADRLKPTGSLSVSPVPAIHGELLAFSGRISPGVRRSLTLQRYWSGSWSTIRHLGLTTSTGSFRFYVVADASSTYRVRAPRTLWRGRTLAAAVTRSRLVQVVGQTVTLQAPAKVSPGELITVKVVVTPVRAGRAVVVQERDAQGGWADVSSAREDATGTAYVTLTRKDSGSWQLRAVVSAANGAPACTSETASWPRAGALVEVGAVNWTRTGSYGYWGSIYTPGNWAVPDDVGYYADESGNLAIVSHDPSAGTLAIDKYDRMTLRHVGAKTSVSLTGWPDWGGFYAGPDGCFYVLVGRDNHAENDTLDVVAVRRYDSDWHLIGAAYVQGGASQGHKGIYSPFDAGAPQMVLVGNRLVVHMSRLLYAEPDGRHHQVNFTFEVDVDVMTTTPFGLLGGYSYCSHSFRQLVAMNSGSLVTIDHGDAYPRAIRMGVMAHYPAQRQVRTYDLFAFNGAIGDNFTGATVTGLVSGPSGVVVIGNSIQHPNAPNGTLGSADERRNVYAIWADPATGTHVLRWLTDFPPLGADNALEPRAVQVGPDKYAILFSVLNGAGYRMEYRLIDSAGTVLGSASFPGAFFCAASNPILLGDKLHWLGIEPDSWPGPVPAHLYGMDVSDPMRPSLLVGAAS